MPALWHIWHTTNKDGAAVLHLEIIYQLEETGKRDESKKQQYKICFSMWDSMCLQHERKQPF